MSSISVSLGVKMSPLSLSLYAGGAGGGNISTFNSEQDKSDLTMAPTSVMIGK